MRCAPGCRQRMVLRYKVRDRAAIYLVRARFRDRRFVSGDCFVQPRLGLEFVLPDRGRILFLDFLLNKGGCPRNDLGGARFSVRRFESGDCFVQPLLGLEFVLLDRSRILFLDFLLNKGGCPRNDLGGAHGFQCSVLYQEIASSSRAWI
mgnify:CR=1 FL=1